MDDFEGYRCRRGKEEVVAISIFTKGTPRQNPRGSPAAEETHEEGARDEAIVDISHSKEPPIGLSFNKKRQKRVTPVTAYQTNVVQTPLPLRSLKIHGDIPNNDSPKINRLSFSSASLHRPKVTHWCSVGSVLMGLMEGLLSPLKSQFLTCRKGEEDQRNQKWCQRKICLPKNQP
jgi:hypothetical protein